MRRILLVLFVITFSASYMALAEKDNHGHDHGKKTDKETEAGQDGDDHNHEKKESTHDEGEKEHGHAEHGEKDEHEEGEEHKENSQVGLGKGITEANEVNGFKLSAEAEKNFEISRIKVSQGSTEIPKSAIVTAVKEVNIYRFREGFYKRIDFEYVSRSSAKVTISSKDLKTGDEIVLQGLGFLRIAEIAAFGGAPEGHSH